MIFKDVRDGRPYPEHGLSMRDWARIPPRQIRMDELITTKRELRLDALLDEDSTFYGDLFGHAVRWEGELYLEDGLHRALRAALQQRTVIHVRILEPGRAAAGAPRRSPATSGRAPRRRITGRRTPATAPIGTPHRNGQSARLQRDPVGQQPAAAASARPDPGPVRHPSSKPSATAACARGSGPAR